MKLFNGTRNIFKKDKRRSDIDMSNMRIINKEIEKKTNGGCYVFGQLSSVKHLAVNFEWNCYIPSKVIDGNYNLCKI